MYTGLKSRLVRTQPQYEYFQPVTETKENPESNLLLIHLPGFKRDEVGVKHDSANRKIKTFGERSLGVNNKFIRFNLAYPLPGNYDASRLQRRFDGETLTIIMPKKVVSKVPPEEEPKPTQQAAAATPPPAVAAEAMPPKSTTHMVEEPKTSAEAQKDHGSASREAETTIDKQKLQPSIAQPMPEKTQEVIPPKSAPKVEEPKSTTEAAAPQEVKTSQEKAPSPSMEAVAEPKTEKTQVETPPKLALEPRDKKSVSSADLKDPNTSREPLAEPRSEKEQVKTPPKSAPPVEEPSNKRSVLLANLRALSTSKDAVAEPKTEKTKVDTPPKSAPTFMEETRDKKRDSSADLKALSPSEEAAAEPKSETAQVETPPKSTLPSVEEPRDKRSVSSADLKSLSHSKEAVAEPITEKAQVETPQKSTPPFEEEPRDKRSVSFADQKAPKDEQDTTTAQKPLPDIEKPADDNQLRSLRPPEPTREVNKPQVVQGEIMQKPTETTLDPNLQTGGVVQKDEEFEPKPTLPTATTKQTDENTEKGPGEFLPKTTLTTAPLDPKKQIEDQLQKDLEDVMQKHENIVGRRAPDPEEKEVKEKIANPFEPRMPEKGMDKDVVKATESKERRELGMAVKPSPETPEKEKEATGDPATIYKEKHKENIIDTIGRGIKEVAASTSYAVTNIAEHQLKNEEKNLLTMVMGALAAHVSYRLTSSGKPQN